MASPPAAIEEGHLALGVLWVLAEAGD